MNLQKTTDELVEFLKDLTAVIPKTPRPDIIVIDVLDATVQALQIQVASMKKARVTAKYPVVFRAVASYLDGIVNLLRAAADELERRPR